MYHQILVEFHIKYIGSGFAGFTADQFKNWVFIYVYSIPTLFGILPTEHLECWRHFVLACLILCKPIISQNDVNLADILLLRFSQRLNGYMELQVLHQTCICIVISKMFL